MTVFPNHYGMSGLVGDTGVGGLPVPSASTPCRVNMCCRTCGERRLLGCVTQTLCYWVYCVKHTAILNFM